MKNVYIILAVCLAAAGGNVQAHGGARQDSGAAPVAKEQKPWGIAGEADRVGRTVAVRMTDAMRFEPDTLQIRQGETVRLVLRNDGRLMHEMVIGTHAGLAEHAEVMRKFPGMEHDEAYMAHVSQGSQGEIVWHFNRAGEFDFVCLIPGHYEAGMGGRIVVKPQAIPE
jgi:uncharacterized cupredoxin-like copper-binding protein